jgi:hypothetical protein
LLPRWMARLDTMVQEKRRPRNDEARVNHAEQILEKLMEQRRRGEAVRFRVPPFRDLTPEELRERRRELEERMRKGWI